MLDFVLVAMSDSKRTHDTSNKKRPRTKCSAAKHHDCVSHSPSPSLSRPSQTSGRTVESVQEELQSGLERRGEGRRGEERTGLLEMKGGREWGRGRERWSTAASTEGGGSSHNWQPRVTDVWRQRIQEISVRISSPCFTQPSLALIPPAPNCNPTSPHSLVLGRNLHIEPHLCPPRET